MTSAKAWSTLATTVSILTCCTFNQAAEVKPVLVEMQAVGCSMACRTQPDCKASINIDGVELVDDSHGIHVAVLQDRTVMALKTGMFHSLHSKTEKSYMREFFETVDQGDIILIVTQRSCQPRDWLSYFQTRSESWDIDVPTRKFDWVPGSSMVLGICKGNCNGTSLGKGFPFVEVSRGTSTPLRRSLKFYSDSMGVLPAPTASGVPDVLATTEQPLEILKGPRMPLVVGVSTSLVALGLLILLVLALRKIAKTNDGCAGRHSNRNSSSKWTSSVRSSSAERPCEENKTVDVVSDSASRAEASDQKCLAFSTPTPSVSTCHIGFDPVKAELKASLQQQLLKQPCRRRLDINQARHQGNCDESLQSDAELETKTDAGFIANEQPIAKSRSGEEFHKTVPTYESPNSQRRRSHSSEFSHRQYVNSDLEAPRGNPPPAISATRNQHSCPGYANTCSSFPGSSSLLFQKTSDLSLNSRCSPVALEPKGSFSEYVHLNGEHSPCTYKTPSGVSKFKAPTIRPPLRPGAYVDMHAREYDRVDGVYQPLLGLTSVEGYEQLSKSV